MLLKDSPDEGGVSPQSSDIVVLFPAPLGPRKPKHCNYVIDAMFDVLIRNFESWNIASGVQRAKWAGRSAPARQALEMRLLVPLWSLDPNSHLQMSSSNSAILLESFHLHSQRIFLQPQLPHPRQLPTHCWIVNSLYSSPREHHSSEPYLAGASVSKSQTWFLGWKCRHRRGKSWVEQIWWSWWAWRWRQTKLVGLTKNLRGREAGLLGWTIVWLRWKEQLLTAAADYRRKRTAEK